MRIKGIMVRPADLETIRLAAYFEKEISKED
jgi:hypothetical protein